VLIAINASDDKSIAGEISVLMGLAGYLLAFFYSAFIKKGTKKVVFKGN